VSVTLNKDAGWWLVLIIWGDRYGDHHCNQLIESAYTHSSTIQGVVVLSDRSDRNIDDRASVVPIPADFNTSEYKSGGYPIKICLFDIEAIPNDALCLYVDLDSAIISEMSELSRLPTNKKLWTIDVFPKRFSKLKRLVNRWTNGNTYQVGNSSAFLFRNQFDGNPTQQFRDLVAKKQLPRKLLHDDRFIAWSCQQIIRGFPPHLVSYFRIEFLAPTLWLAFLKSFTYRKRRQTIAILTFAGSKTKLEQLNALENDEVIIDHHRRKGKWNDIYTSGLKSRVNRSTSSR